MQKRLPRNRRLQALVDLQSVSTLFRRAFPNRQDPGACLLIAQRGELRHLEYNGLANLETGTAITGETNFRLASVTKQFTAAAILLLREQSQLELEDPLIRFFPDFPAYGAESITLLHLLQHTSGLLDYEDFVNQEATEPVLDEDVLELTKRHERTYFHPGTQFRYSNTGYALLACIVQKVTGKTFPTAMEELIFAPLGMMNTVVLHRRHRREVPNRALGYWRQPNGSILETDQNLTSAVLGDGGIYCSANDYLIWDKTLWEGKLLPLDVIEEMMTPGMLNIDSSQMSGETGGPWFPEDMEEEWEAALPQQTCVLSGGMADADVNGCRIPYGMGWRLETNEHGLRVAYHPGSTTGFNHCVRRVQEPGLTVLLLANRTSAGSKELARTIESSILKAGQ